MQLLIIALATIIVSCAADVSHLNNEYLPPDQPSASEVQNNQLSLDVRNLDGAEAIAPTHLSENRISIDSVVKQSEPVVEQQVVEQQDVEQQSAPVVEQQSVVLEQHADVQVAAPLPSHFNTRFSAEQGEESHQINVVQDAPQPQHIQQPTQQQLPVQLDVPQQLIQQPTQQQQLPVQLDVPQQQLQVQQTVPQQVSVQQAVPQQVQQHVAHQASVHHAVPQQVQHRVAQQVSVHQGVPQQVQQRVAQQVSVHQAVPQQVQQRVAQVQHVVVSDQQQEHHQQVSSGIDTRYGANGGYIY